MKIPDDLISEIRTEIEKKKLELKELESALNVLDKFGLNTGNPVKVPQNISPIKDIDSISIDDLDVQDNSSKETFKDQIAKFVMKLGSQEFTVKHVEAALIKYGVHVNGKSPRSRISIALNKLVDEKVLSRTYLGVGNVPNKFKYVDYDNEL